MFNLSFWRNSKAKKSGSKANLSVISVTFVFWKKKSLPTTTFLISSFISHSLSHFSKMSLEHTCRCSPTPCLWAIINLLDPSSFFSISFWSAGMNFTLSSRLLEAVSTDVAHSVIVFFITLFQHVSSSTRPSSYSSISHSFDHVAVSIVCCCNSNPLSGRAAATFSNTFSTTSSLLPSKSSFKWWRKEGLSGSWSHCLSYEPQQQREKVFLVGCQWITCNSYKINNIPKKLISSFPLFLSWWVPSVCTHISWIETTW